MTFKDSFQPKIFYDSMKVNLFNMYHQQLESSNTLSLFPHYYKYIGSSSRFAS